MSHPANHLCYRFRTSQAQSLPALLCTCRSHRSKVHAALPWCAWSHCSPGRLQRRPHQLPLSLPALRALLAWNMSAEGKSSTFQMCNWRGAGARTKISGLDRCEALHRKAAQAIPHLARHARPDHKVMDMKGMNITTPVHHFFFTLRWTLHSHINIRFVEPRRATLALFGAGFRVKHTCKHVKSCEYIIHPRAPCLESWSKEALQLKICLWSTPSIRAIRSLKAT